MARTARRRSSLLSPMYYARRAAIRRGFLGGRRGWQFFGVAYFGVKFIRSALGKDVEVVTVESLRPGEAVRIAAIDPKTLRGES